MPSARRHRFSVQNEIANQDINKAQNENQISQTDPDLEVKLAQNYNSGNNFKHRNKIQPNTSKKSSVLEIVTESKTSVPIVQDKRITSDKKVNASSSSINLFTILNTINLIFTSDSKENVKFNNEINKYDAELRRDRTPRRDKYIHRVKVRSPKRKTPPVDKEIKKKSIGLNAYENDCEEPHQKSKIEIPIIKQVIDVGENTVENEKTSSNSMENMCRICHSGEAVSLDVGNLISACSCKGTIGKVHVKCLEHWLTESGKSRCELCGTKYATRRVHRFGVLRGLVIWLLNHHSKHENVKFNNEINKYNAELRRDRTPRRDKYIHRVKVRSPKRKTPPMDKEIKKKSIGVNACENNREEPLQKSKIEIPIIKQVIDIGENTVENERTSSNSMENMCRICHSDEAVSLDVGNLISACSCRGTIGKVHVKCLEHWLTESGKSRCELCGTKYAIRRFHRFGVLRGFVIWLLSHHSKHMIVNFTGIVIMTPIALVAAGLTGRTFASLMSYNHLPQWPLASTFVLACMTVVCYYCWIVAVLIYHSLEWWSWYRSQYEVRLELQENEE